MSQIFSADAQVSADNTNIAAAGSAPLVATRALQPPYNTSKAKVLAVFTLVPDADETEFDYEIVRNPASENLIVGAGSASFAAGTGTVTIALGAVDLIPDQRAVNYQLNGTATSNTGDDVILAGAYIEATLISG